MSPLLRYIIIPYYFFLHTAASAQPRSSDKIIFLLAGQSNMAGRGGVVNNIWDGVIPAQCRASPWILRLNADHQWEEAEEPLARGIDNSNRTCGVGPGMPFAHWLIRKGVGLSGPIGLVPCAFGGTNISRWARGGYLYRRLVKRAWASVEEGGTIQGLIWYQGESDTVIRSDALTYKKRLERFFLDFRADLQSPVLPIIQVAITSGEGPYIEIVRQAQLGINLLNLKTVDAKGLPLEPDHLHLTMPSQIQLGEQLADAYLQFLPSQQVQSTTTTTTTTNTGNILHTNSFYTVLILSCILHLLYYHTNYTV